MASPAACTAHGGAEERATRCAIALPPVLRPVAAGAAAGSRVAAPRSLCGSRCKYCGVSARVPRLAPAAWNSPGALASSNPSAPSRACILGGREGAGDLRLLFFSPLRLLFREPRAGSGETREPRPNTTHPPTSSSIRAAISAARPLEEKFCFKFIFKLKAPTLRL